MIVHGHSTAAEPMVSDNRIGIDTGAYATGILTCLRIHGQEWKLIGVRLAGCGLWSE
jgi:serine/threonine protein phosphatase 1